MKKILVVGAGPAGMMAAIRAGELGAEVILLERNALPGRKLLLSGKGRCNLTNACGLDDFLPRFSNGQFLRDAFKKFFNQDLMRFFEKNGLKLKIERQERVFPESGRSSSILNVLLKQLQQNKVKIVFDSRVTQVFVKNNQARGVILETGRVASSDKVILATGGVSYAFTGSTGDGINFSAKLGHKITPLKAGLASVVIKENYPRLLEGLSLKNIQLKISAGDKELISGVGELLFTAFGVSGPLIFTLSGKISDFLEEKKNVFLEIDLKPGLSREQLDIRILREFQANPKKSLRNILKTLLPLRLIDLFIRMLKIDSHKSASQITAAERAKMIELLKGFCLQVKSLPPIEEAMVTRGGVSLKDINPRTMESRLIRGLYFCGEMIDLDADTGGFNLQAAFSTGYLAGESAAG